MNRQPHPRGTIEHVPIIGQPSPHPAARATVIFDAETGRKIGASPNFKIEQTEYRKYRGTITTTLKITPLKPKDT